MTARMKRKERRAVTVTLSTIRMMVPADAAARAKNRAVRAEVRARAQERRVTGTGMMVVAKRRRSAR
eukprot:scaffold17149_cov120-Isochrysis_galbana.AAC.2